MIKVKEFKDEWLLGDPDTFSSAENQLNEFLENNNIEFVDVKYTILGNSSQTALLLIYKEK